MMQQKITVRFGVVITLIYLLPVIIFSKFAYDAYRDYKRPLVIDDGQFYVICTFTGCSTFEKKTINNLKYPPSYFLPPQKALRDPNFNFEEYDIASRYYSALETAKFEREMAKQHFYFYAPICLLFLLPFLYFWLSNKITLINDVVTVKSTLPPFIKKAFKGSFNINSVERINIITTTPFIPKRTNIDQINWREVVEIVYRNPAGQIDSIAVPLFLFPGFKKIVKKIIERNPAIKISFF